MPQGTGRPASNMRWPAIGAVMGALSLFLTVMVGLLLLLPQRGDLRIELTAHGGGQVSRAEIFVDGQGRYLGEVVASDRLMHNKYSPHLFGYFGHFGYYGNVGRYSEPGKMGMIGLPMGFVDIDVTRLG